MDDERLVAAIRRGEMDAAASFCARIAPRVVGTVSRLLGPHDPDRDDVAQKAMMEITASASSFRGEASLEGWAAAITARVVYKHIRRRRLERRFFVESDPEGDDERSTKPNNLVVLEGSARVEARQQLARVFELLASLDEEKVLPYLLHDICGFDLREIAGIVGASVAATQSRLVRGRKLVHDLLLAHPELRIDTEGT